MESIVKEIIDGVNKNKRIRDMVSKYKVNEEMIERNAPLFYKMLEEDLNETSIYMTSFIVDNGILAPFTELSPYGKEVNYKRNIISENFLPTNFYDDEKFDAKNINRKEAVNRVYQILKSDDEFIKGIFLYGDMGIGKTFTLKKIAVKLAKQDKKVAFVNTAALAGLVKSKFGSNVKNITYEELLTSLKKVDFLLIDDIGAEPIVPWFRDEFLLSILDYRMNYSKHTFFTSNYSIDGLIKVQQKNTKSHTNDNKQAERLIDRIKALSTEFKLKGKNKRY